MKETLRLLCVAAHPDDESMGFGSALVKYDAEGVETFLVMATHRERGWNVPGQEYPGQQNVARVRQAELEQAVRILGIKQLFFLNYIDGEVEHSLPTEAIAQITTYIRQLRPQVVITFGPDGVYGHPDHIAVSQLQLLLWCTQVQPSTRILATSHRTWFRNFTISLMNRICIRLLQLYLMIFVSP